MLEDVEFVPVLAQGADAVAQELGDGGAVHEDAFLGRFDDRVAREGERSRVRHRGGPLDAGEVASNVERDDLELYVDERVRHEGYDIELLAARELGEVPDLGVASPLGPALSGIQRKQPPPGPMASGRVLNLS